jgi:hypothetical protein
MDCIYVFSCWVSPCDRFCSQYFVLVSGLSPVLHVHLHLQEGQAGKDRITSNKATLSRISGRNGKKITVTFLVHATNI